MPKVLCVDDNVDLADVLSDILEFTGYEVRAVNGGRDCLDLLNKREFWPDIILLDIMMAPMDGWETLKYIREDPTLSAIPVMMLTGKYPTMAEINANCSLFEGYLMKPFAIKQVGVEIEMVLERTKVRDLVINDAREKGASEVMLNDYRRLSSVSRVIEQFENIITNGSFVRDTFVNAENKLKYIEQEMIDLGVIINK